MKKAKLKLGAKSYEVWIGRGAVREIGKKKSLSRTKTGKRRAIIIADEKLLGARIALKAALAPHFLEVHEIAVKAGEDFKEISALFPVYGEMLKAKADRDTVLFALGGGSIGDAAGFIASSYLRGIDWVGVPTTLLAQVDSSVGGKTGINHPYGKNLIGSFHQPKLVVCDTDFLNTLGDSEVVSGIGEILKTALIFDPKFYLYLQKNRSLLLKRDPKILKAAIHRSVVWKCKTVARDEYDRKGVREALNFGHTFGHALEKATKYKVFQHGEAVLYGMRFALALSQIRGKLTAKKREAIDAVICGFKIPKVPEKISVKEILAGMANDKKTRNGKIHFVLLSRIGKTVSDSGVTSEDLVKAHALLDREIEGVRK